MTHKEQAARLRRWNRWRKGEGEFAWHEDPRENLPMPESPQELSQLIEEVAEVLDGLEDSRQPATESKKAMKGGGR